MWLLHLLPDSFLLFVVNAVLGLGIILTLLTVVIINPLLRFFPMLASYYRIAQVISICVLLTGVYFKGGYSTEMMWREKVAEVQEKLKVAENKAPQINTVVEEKVITKTKVIKQKGDSIVEYVDREIVKYDKTCPLPQEVVEAHNQAAEMNKHVDTVNSVAQGASKK